MITYSMAVKPVRLPSARYRARHSGLTRLTRRRNSPGFGVPMLYRKRRALLRRASLFLRSPPKHGLLLFNLYDEYFSPVIDEINLLVLANAVAEIKAEAVNFAVLVF